MRLPPRQTVRLGAALTALTLAVTPSVARADWDFADWSKHVRITGFLQPGFEWIQHSAGSDVEGSATLQPQAAKLDRLGFAQSRVRALALGNWKLGEVDFDFRLEIEGLPQPTIYDAYIAARGPLAGGGFWRVVAGQHKAPFDRQILVWDPDLQLATKAWITGSEPGHQIGLSAQLNVPYAPWIQISAGAYNGEGRNQLENVDKNLMYVARLALRPIGGNVPLAESAFGDTQLSIAGDVSYNTINLGDADQKQLLAGADLFASWRGLSAFGSVLWGNTTFAAHPGHTNANQDYKTLGYNAQAGYLLPIPGYLYQRFEVVGRFQGIARNQAVMLANLADPNQAQYDIAAGINYYQRGHGLKIQVNYDHYLYPKDFNRGVAADLAANAVFVLITYKLE